MATTHRKTADGQPQKNKPKIGGGVDPLDLNTRLYNQLSKLLDDMERADRDELMTMPQRISALIAVARVQKMFQDLRKGDLNVGAGSAVTKYAAAFAAADGASSRNPYPRPILVELDSSTDASDDERDDED